MVYLRFFITSFVYRNYLYRKYTSSSEILNILGLDYMVGGWTKWFLEIHSNPNNSVNQTIQVKQLKELKYWSKPDTKIFHCRKFTQLNNASHYI